MKRRLFSALALASSVALAAPVTVTTQTPQVFWKEPNSFVVSTMEGEFQLNVRTGATRSLESQGDAPDGALGRELKSSRTSPDGKAKATIKVQVQTGDGAWAGGVFTPPGKLTTQLLVERDGKLSPSTSWDGVRSADVFWSPDGRYVLWIVGTTDWMGMDGSSRVTLLVGGGGGPRTQILAAADVLEKVTPGVTKAAEASGLTVVFTGKAKKARDTTVVYAAKGFEEVAAKAAAAMPGGATVEPLSWEAGADVVIAAGRSALGGGK
jgi:hypothetical protein